eukprot:890592-Amorphochlora_amoeboformis.AAC.1
MDTIVSAVWQLCVRICEHFWVRLGLGNGAFFVNIGNPALVLGSQVGYGGLGVPVADQALNVLFCLTWGAP